MHFSNFVLGRPFIHLKVVVSNCMYIESIRIVGPYVSWIHV